ncbi:16S rRNA (guanine(966)-N(2))-methyltransferase RsmD [Seinonella peptonophila]|uniref:16S rRNA (Guanine(966)-N(2))-methyltransferase RsmD n=2 Tax=Seinonella peptonophila TaxID=112248 RepID=A0A1M4UUF9_9BACL|nr:16S rRNA (guanine(966)-N(2))-methyltransferase RsmD [Seinonella peptonophila]
MRVISGECKGTRLQMVPGSHVRPTIDRVKESLFDLIGQRFSGGEVLDLFAGTGGLGIEALSRGMDRAFFVDQSNVSIHTIRENLSRTRLTKQADIFRGDARTACRLLEKQKRKFDLIFLDPPYQRPILLPIMKELTKRNLLKIDGMAVIESPHTVDLPEEIDSWVLRKQRSYGNTMITIYDCCQDVKGE